MDIRALVGGFVVGTATGAIGTYLADKYTDIRRPSSNFQLLRNRGGVTGEYERTFVGMTEVDCSWIYYWWPVHSCGANYPSG